MGGNSSNGCDHDHDTDDTTEVDADEEASFLTAVRESFGDGEVEPS